MITKNGALIFGAGKMKNQSIQPAFSLKMKLYTKAKMSRKFLKLMMDI